jgi:hypothetical protein
LETSHSDLTIDEFNYLQIACPENLNIYKSDSGYIIVLKDVDVSDSLILQTIVRKSKSYITPTELDDCRFEIQRCTRGNLKKRGDGIILIVKEDDHVASVDVRGLSYFERLLFTMGSDDKLGMDIEMEHYKLFLNKIYADNISTLAYFIKSYEFYNSQKLLGIIKYLVTISSPLELQKINSLRGVENTCVVAYDPKTKYISKLVRCWYSDQSQLDIPDNKVLYETPCQIKELSKFLECYTSTPLQSTTNMFFVAIINDDARFVMDFMNIYINSLECLCLAKLCGRNLIYNFILAASDQNIMKKNKFYKFYETVMLNHKSLQQLMIRLGSNQDLD